MNAKKLVLFGLGSIALSCTGVGCTSEQFIESAPGGALDPTARKSTVAIPGVRLTEEFLDLTDVATVEIPNRVDLLWMIDNSPSMGDNQAKLANDFQAFADTYLDSGTGRDLRIARITSDAYKAGESGGDCGTFPAACDARASKLLEGWADGTFPQMGGARSARPILSTFAPAGFVGDWIEQLKDDFNVNMLVGTSGHNSERGMQSVSKLISDNEQGIACDARSATDPQCFFRKNTIRGIIMLSDELDSSEYAGRPAGNIKDTPVVNYNVAAFKSQVDTFFKGLDGTNDPKYFVTAIVAQSNAGAAKAYNALADAVLADGSNSVASNSKKEDIASASYATILQNIGETVSENQSVTATSFTLAGVPDSILNVGVFVIDAAGAEHEIPNQVGNFVLENGNIIRVTFDILQSYPGAQKVLIAYTPM